MPEIMVWVLAGLAAVALAAALVKAKRNLGDGLNALKGGHHGR